MRQLRLESLEDRDLPSFAAPYAVPGPGKLLGAVDVNRDGRDDLVFDHGAVLLAQTDGTFRTLNSATDATYFRVVAVRDFTGDGLPDQLWAWNVGGTPFLQPGLGDGTFGPAQDRPELAPLTHATTLAAGDLNGDGKPDLFAFPWSLPPDLAALTPGGPTGRVVRGCSSAWDADVFVAFGNGDGTFQPPTFQSMMYPGNLPWQFADLDGDGRTDLVSALTGAGQVVVERGHAGAFGWVETYGVGAPITSLAVADVTGDGRPDVVVGTVAADGTGGIAVLVNQPDGTLAGPVNTPLPGGHPVGADSLVVGDFNGDGRPDVIAGLERADGGNSILVDLTFLAGRGDGTFDPPRRLGQQVAGQLPGPLLAQDLDGDGHLDLVFQAYADGGPVVVLRGHGDGTFDLPPDTPGDGEWVFGDLNGDGRADRLARADFASGHWLVTLNQGGGAFTPAGAVDLPRDVGGLAVVEATGDGRADLAAFDGDTGALVVAPGNGDGTFGPLKVSAAGPGHYFQQSAWADLNGDGVADLVGTTLDFDPVTNRYFQRLLIARNNGDGTFQDPEALQPAPGSFGPLAVGDVTGDGRPDLVVVATAGNPEQPRLYLLRNDSTAGAWAFTPQSLDLPADNLDSLALTDLNGDGRADLATVRHSPIWGPTPGREFLQVAETQADGSILGQPPQPLADASGLVLRLSLPGGEPALLTTDGDLATVWRPAADGTFRPDPTVWLGGVAPPRVVDYDGDGRTDLVAVLGGLPTFGHRILPG